jgi:asparagine synthase (glutamine-hydrolysing)
MCGIVGTIGFVDRDLLENMTSVIHHRGPDDGGMECFTDKTPVGFGFRRLAIIDLSPLGHQPMFNTEKTLCIIFNGEIYNYQEVKSELLKKGYTFKSATDTEVILNAYAEWGFKCVERLRGMWGFAIYDLKKRYRLHFSRPIRRKTALLHAASKQPIDICFGSQIHFAIARSCP